MSHECPAPNCQITVRDTSLACSRHWYALPADLRAKINHEYQHHGLSARLRVLQAKAFAYWTDALR